MFQGSLHSGVLAGPAAPKSLDQTRRAPPGRQRALSARCQQGGRRRLLTPPHPSVVEAPTFPTRPCPHPTSSGSTFPRQPWRGGSLPLSKPILSAQKAPSSGQRTGRWSPRVQSRSLGWASPAAGMAWSGGHLASLQLGPCQPELPHLQGSRPGVALMGRGLCGAGAERGQRGRKAPGGSCALGRHWTKGQEDMAGQLWCGSQEVPWTGCSPLRRAFSCIRELFKKRKTFTLF